MLKNTDQKAKNETPQMNGANKALNIIGLVLCIILVPILIVNCTLIVKSWINKDDVPSIGGVMPLIVLTDSMYPDIKSGDIIICKQVDAESIEVGDDISFFDPAGNGSSIVTHRVIEIIEKDGQLFFRTKGINNNTEDRLHGRSLRACGQRCTVYADSPRSYRVRDRADRFVGRI